MARDRLAQIDACGVNNNVWRAKRFAALLSQMGDRQSIEKIAYHRGCLSACVVDVANRFAEHIGTTRDADNTRTGFC